MTIAAGSSVSVTRYLREHGSAEHSSADFSTGELSGLQLMPVDTALVVPDSSESFETCWNRLRNEAVELKARLEKAEETGPAMGNFLLFLAVFLETSQMQSRRFKAQIDISRCEAAHEHKRKEAADAEANTLRFQLSALEMEMAKLRASMGAAENVRFRDAEAELNRLAVCLESAQVDATTQRCKADSVQNEAFKLQALVELADARSNKRQSELRSKLELATSEAALERSRADLTRTEFQSANDSAASEMSRAQAADAESVKFAQRLRLAEAELQSEAEIAGVRLGAVEAAASAHCSRIGALEAEAASLRGQGRSDKEEVSGLQLQMNSLRTGVEVQSSRADVAETEVGRLKSFLSAKETSLTQLQAQLDVAKVEAHQNSLHGDMELKTQQKLQLMVSEASAHAGEHGALQAEATELRAALDGANGQLAKCRLQAETASEEFSEANSQLGKWRRQAESASEEFTQASNQLGNWRRQTENVSEELSDANKLLGNWRRQAESVSEELSDANNQLGKWRRQAESASEELLDANSQLGKCRRQAESASEELLDANSQLDKCRRQAESASEELLDANNQLERWRKQAASASDKLAGATAHRAQQDAIQAEVAELKGALDFANEQLARWRSQAEIASEELALTKSRLGVLEVEHGKLPAAKEAADELERVIKRISELELQLNVKDCIIYSQHQAEQDTATKNQDVQVVCSCGNVFLPDAVFCRKCGKKRPCEQALEQQALNVRISNLYAQLSSQRDALASKLVLQEQLLLRSEQGRSEHAGVNEMKHGELKLELAEQTALNEQHSLHISELKLQLIRQEQALEKTVPGSSYSELERNLHELEIQNSELKCRLTQECELFRQHECTISKLEAALPCSECSELEAQSASRQRALRDSEDRSQRSESRAQAVESESRVLQAELAQERRAIAEARSAESRLALELQAHRDGAERTVQAALAREMDAAGHQLLASDQQVRALRSELDQRLAEDSANAESMAAQAGELRRLEQEVASQQKEVRTRQNGLDALESQSSFLQGQAEEEHHAFRAARSREVLATSRIDELESELMHQRNAMKDAVSWAKANTKHRLRSAESKRKDLQLQLDERRDSEEQLAQQEMELRELLEVVKLESEEDLEACETQNVDLQAELAKERELLQACATRRAELEDLLGKQREATAAEASAMEGVSELATELARQRDQVKETCEARVKKLKARIRDLEMMLEISKEFLRGEPNKTGRGEPNESVDSVPEASVLIQQTPPKLSEEMWACKMGRPQDRALGGSMRSEKQHSGRGMRMSRSAGSLHPRSHSPYSANPLRSYVVRDAGFSWPGRHVGPDFEGPVKVTFEE